MKTLLAAAALSCFAAGSAFAADTTGGGMMMADHATATIRYVTVAPADIMSSKLVGQDVYNNQGDKIGNVADLVIDNGKTVTGVVLSVGGFLGMGEHYVLIDPASMVLSDKNGLHGVVDTNKDTLKNAPAFNYKKS
ncbi:PRC-barrel domain containing protein [Lichenibacterium minor]|jgi:sporulation protein YlmC with PRC-barrel domain|uniref:PRC-barrel domain containing protein n=1 Tax=Lichenibacterium minor TaxID=2316528 RepID=A0A4Q2TZC3_9HYPH|nr:PRC-barrel domain-containing protein [Lichenibacterium minor]RYC29473.1 PRC-barrel domain containing protein [Lichenibacterium minor]